MADGGNPYPPAGESPYPPSGGTPYPPPGGGPEYPPPGGGPEYPAPPPPRRSKRTLIALVVGVVAIIGGGVFAATQLMGSSTSPEAAVEKLFKAAADEDFLGLLEALTPGERDVLKGPIQDIVAELKRLEILSRDADLGDFAGVEIEVDDLELSSSPIRDGMAEVRIDRGTLRTSADPAKLPLGGFVRDVAGEDLDDATALGPEVSDLRSEGPTEVLVTVKDDGRWYFSLWYTVAELTRRESGAPMPDLAQRVDANGADSAEGAVDAFLRATVRLDLRRLIELLPPDEARALHDYAPLFLDEAREAGDDFRRSVQIDITQLELRTAGRNGDRTLVQIEKLGFNGVVRDENLRITYRDGCATLAPLTGRGQPERICPGDFEDGAPELFERFLGTESPDIDVEQPALGFAAVEREGKWFVSPTATVLDNILAVLKVLDRGDLDALRDLAEEFD